MTRKKGFTLIELLVVLAIIGILAIVVLVSLNSARAKARDARRLQDMQNITKALYMYYDSNGSFPANTDTDCTTDLTWDTGYYSNGGDTSFINSLVTSGLFSKVPGDPTNTDICGGYRYRRYAAGTNGCAVSRGTYFVLGVEDMETSSGVYPTSPGWSCSGGNWQDYMDWVTGGFEK